MDVGDEPRMIGQRLRRIRNYRGKSLVVVAGLAGVSKSHLHRIETGQRALDSRSETVAIANALGISPSELTRLPVPAPGNGDNDAAVKAVSRALMAVNRKRPRGEVVSVDVLRARVRSLVDTGRQCRQTEVGAALPALIRDVHTSIAAGRDVAELLELAVMMHTQGSHAWLRVMGAEVEVRSLATVAARQAAEHRDEPATLGLALFGDGLVMLASGDFDLARDELDSVTVPTNSSESMQVAGMLGLCRSLVAAADKRPADVEAALDYAGELAERTGEGNAYWLGFGPTNVGLWRMAAALEVRDYERVATIAEHLNPQAHPNLSRQTAYWLDYGRALARLRGRQDDAVMALHRGETLSPLHMQRNPFVRDVLGELLARRSRRDDAVSVELRGMAYRAGLPM
ncbi:MAG: helix-turn-helix domain-containing protein [Pseudonocardiaceae bacterium]